MADTKPPPGPLGSLDEWEDFVLKRYPEGGDVSNKFDKEFRDYDDPARDTVREFYRLNHRHQTLEFAQAKKREFEKHDRKEMGVWEACEFLNTLIDNSDPDTDLSQIQYLLQTAEAIRADGIRGGSC